MKRVKLFFVAASVIAVASAFATKEQKVSAIKPAYLITLKKDVANCPSRTCDANGTIDCTDLRETNCTGAFYTGTLRRSVD